MDGAWRQPTVTGVGSAPWVVVPEEGGPGDLRRGSYPALGLRRREPVLHELCLRLTRCPTFDYEGVPALSHPGDVCDQSNGQSPLPVSGSIPIAAVTVR